MTNTPREVSRGDAESQVDNVVEYADARSVLFEKRHAPASHIRPARLWMRSMTDRSRTKTMRQYETKGKHH